MGRDASSASAHAFGSTPPFTLGIEEEFMLLDPDTLDLVQRAAAVLAAAGGGALAGGSISSELFQSEVEVQTPVCETVAEAETELRQLRLRLQELVHDAGLVLGSAGTHPFAYYEHQQLTDKARYRSIVDAVQYPARRELIFGLHVHVGVGDPDAAIAVLNGLRPHICDLVALSASSPFWRGTPTGLRSTRQTVFATFPRSGVPPAFGDYAEFAAFVALLERAGVLEDYTRIWWDIRPHPRLGTVEVRAMDAVGRVEDVIAIAAYIQALAWRSAHPQTRPWRSALEDQVVRENKWQAVRHGLAAQIVDPRAGGGSCSLSSWILATLDDLVPVAEELGTLPYLEHLERLVGRGSGAERQLVAYECAGDVRAAARSIAEETDGCRLPVHSRGRAES
jgi:glutamate---cysteine ligase / carboxylate-amine ligase